MVNADHDRGVFSSVQVGAAALSPDIRGFFVLPADCPLVDRTVPEALIEAFGRHDGARPVVPTHGGRGGHPVLLPARARQTLMDAPITATLRAVIRTLDPLR